MDRTAILTAEVEALRGDNEALQQGVTDWQRRAEAEKRRADEAQRKVADALTQIRAWRRPAQ